MAKATSGGRGVGEHPLMTGMVVGVLIGLCVALGLALYLTKSNPFVAKSQPAADKPKKEPVEPEKPVPGMPVQESKSARPQTAPAEGKSGESRFDFYEILPKSGESSPERKPGNAAGQRHDVYYLQAGAFQKSSDADNLKARLALAGLEAQIVTATVSGSVWHRVRLGPFENESAMSEARGVLQENHIEAKVMKAAANAKE